MRFFSKSHEYWEKARLSGLHVNPFTWGDKNNHHQKKNLSTIAIGGVVRRPGPQARPWEFLLWVPFFSKHLVEVSLQKEASWGAMDSTSCCLFATLMVTSRDTMVFLPCLGLPFLWTHDGQRRDSTQAIWDEGNTLAVDQTPKLWSFTLMRRKLCSPRVFGWWCFSLSSLAHVRTAQCPSHLQVPWGRR